MAHSTTPKQVVAVSVGKSVAANLFDYHGQRLAIGSEIAQVDASSLDGQKGFVSQATEYAIEPLCPLRVLCTEPIVNFAPVTPLVVVNQHTELLDRGMT